MQGKYAEAETLYEWCQTMLGKVFDPEHPSFATTLHNQARLLQAQVNADGSLLWSCVDVWTTVSVVQVVR